MKRLIVILIFALAPLALKAQVAKQVEKDSKEAAHEVKRVSKKVATKAKKDTKYVARAAG
jgi:hypothetical protein